MYEFLLIKYVVYSKTEEAISHNEISLGKFIYMAHIFDKMTNKYSHNTSLHNK